MPTGVFSRLDRTLPGDGVVVRDAAMVVVRRPSRLADAGPNAPLLMRIVRYPYALAAGRPARRAYRGAPDAIGFRPRAFSLHASRFVRLPDEA
jgi:hypothetical protein